MLVKIPNPIVLVCLEVLIMAGSVATAERSEKDEKVGKECHPKPCRIWIAIIPLVITNFVTLSCCLRKSRKRSKIHPNSRERGTAGRKASFKELGVPKLARELFLVRNHSTLRTCEIKENYKQPETPILCGSHPDTTYKTNRNCLPEERPNQSSFDTKGRTHSTHERQHATTTVQEDISCEQVQGKRHRLLGYESSVCSTDIELTPRRTSELKSKINVLYQSSFESSDGECDGTLVKPARAQVNRHSKLPSRLAKHTIISDSEELKYATNREKQGKYRSGETVTEGEKCEHLVVDLKNVLETEQYLEDSYNSVSSGLGIDSLQQLNSQCRRVCSLKSEISFESINSYTSLRSGFLAGEEDNGEGLTDEDERKKHFEKKKKKHSNKQLTNNVVIEINSSQKESRLSSDRVETEGTQSASLTAQEDDPFPTSENDRTLGSVSIHVGCSDQNAASEEENASAGSKSTVRNSHLHKDGAFDVSSAQEHREIDPISLPPKVLRIENAKLASLRTDSVGPDQCTSNKPKPVTSNNDLSTTLLRLRLFNAVRERYGRNIYQSIDIDKDEQENGEHICV